MLDQTPTRSHSVVPIGALTPVSGTMPIMTPLYTTPPGTPMAMHGGFVSPRNIQPYGRLENRRHNAMRVSRSPYYNNAGHHNHVDVNRIRDGIDVRTTVRGPRVARVILAYPNRSCCGTFQTRSTRLCSSGLWTSRAGESTISCTCESTSPMTASEYASSRRSLFRCLHIIRSVGYAFINFVDVSICSPFPVIAANGGPAVGHYRCTCGASSHFLACWSRLQNVASSDTSLVCECTGQPALELFQERQGGRDFVRQ